MWNEKFYLENFKYPLYYSFGFNVEHDAPHVLWPTFKLTDLVFLFIASRKHVLSCLLIDKVFWGYQKKFMS